MSSDPDDASIADQILALCRIQGAGKTICPSDVARILRCEDWRSLMPRVRNIAARLADDGLIEVTQQGQAVDPRGARGPIRLRLAEQTEGDARE